MPEEVKVSPYTVVSQKEYRSQSVDDSSRDSSFSGEMNRSESSGSFDESNGFKQNGHESIEIIPTRTIKTSVPKPAVNPLQFVKIGPCGLYRSAQQQLQKVSEVKKPKKEVKDEMEDWQSNLDSWKCNRRKQQEHIIERVVEVKKLELEEHDRNKKRTKTFSEMMEERTSKGRKLSLPLYVEDESDDLSDLGISSSKNLIKSPTIPEENETKFENTQNGEQDKCDQNGEDKNSKEDTYDSAIQSYENRMKSLSNGKVPTRKYNTRRGSAAKIEEKLSELEKIKNRSVSTTDLTENNKKQINIPKVNIFQRKEMFEKMSAEESCKNKLKDELPAVRSIKDRLHSLEKQVEENTTNKAKNVPLTEISVKDRLSHINEKMRQNSTCSEKCAGERAPSKDDAKEEATYQDFNGTKQEVPLQANREYSSGRSSSSEDYEHVQMNHFHHRSLDSLQGHDSPNGFCFERVQSLECIDCCSNYPASVLSGDTDREDSGIHTADVSSSVSQADDFDLHADTSMDVDVKQTPPIAEESKADKSSHNDFHFVSQNDNVLEPTNTSNLDNKNANQNTPNGSPENDRSSIEVYDLVDLDVGKRSEPKRESFAESNLIQVDHFGGDDKNQNISDLNESTLVNGSKDDDKRDPSFAKSVEEETYGKREFSSEQATNDSTLSDVTKPNGYENEYSVKNSFKEEEEEEEEEVEVNNSFVNDVPRNQNCYETDSSEYASDFASSTAEQRIDYLYMKNNQYIGEFPNASQNQEPALFAFESSTAVEPPKEKPPPPPPIENNDDELDVNENKSCLRRMDSTKRIKKELRQKRSSFLGIEGFDDDSYLEPESVKPPPDMTTFLQEERRLEKLLYRQSICSESDSTQGESRDSGVELDKNQIDENSWMPENMHNRQDSETYANTSTTSEEDEIIKKEREILEILELEEQRHYETEPKNEYNNLGEKLVLRLQELERQKTVPCWTSREQELLNNQRNLVNQQNYITYEEPPMNNSTPHYNGNDNVVPHEAIKSTDSALLQQQWAGRSLQDITQDEIPPPVSEEYNTKHRVAYRNSMPNIQQELSVANHYHRVPPPIPPNKPSTHFREPAVVNKVSSPQQMSKQTLQALSAVPRSKIVATDSWVLSKKKPRQEAYNYQHWLIQEAEHRRITEYQQRHRNDNVVQSNYVNTHSDYVEQGVISNGENRSHQNRSLYAHPQMLPYRNHDQYHDKNYNKPQSNKPLPDSVIQTLTQRVQNRLSIADNNKPRRRDNFVSNQQEKMLSVSGKKKCSHCGDELGRGAAMIIESLRLFYHIDCFKCCVCCVQLGDGLMGTDVRVRNDKLHCHSCYSNDEGLKFSCV